MKSLFFKSLFSMTLALLISCGNNYSENEKAVENGLKYIMGIEDEGSIYVDFDYLQALAETKFYRIDDWELNTLSQNDSLSTIRVNGTVTNAFGKKLKRKPTFMVKLTENGLWQITDSDDFFVGTDIENINLDLSDLEKFKILSSLTDSLKIEEWSFSIDSRGTVRGEGTIYNASMIPVEFIKASVNYKNDKGININSDEFYVISNGNLEPGQRRQFNWNTRNCIDCENASLKLLID